MELIKRCITGLLFGLVLAFTYFYAPPVIFSTLLLALLILILLFEMAWILNYNQCTNWFLTILYPILPFVFLILLNQSPLYHHLILLIFVVSFSCDVGAYFTGKFLGKHKLCPSISPKKTWEGLVGGILSVFITLKILTFYTGSSISIIKLLVLACLFAVTAVAGDFFESYLKRKAKIKDSGNFLPGHGGLLDRFDSVMAVATLTFFLKDYVMLWIF